MIIWRVVVIIRETLSDPSDAFLSISPSLSVGWEGTRCVKLELSRISWDCYLKHENLIVGLMIFCGIDNLIDGNSVNLLSYQNMAKERDAR